MSLFLVTRILFGLKKNFLLLPVPFLPTFRHVFKKNMKPKLIIPIGFPSNLVLTKGVVGHLSTLTLPIVVASLGFKKENLIGILVSSLEIPFTSQPRAGLLSPRFKS